MKNKHLRVIAGVFICSAVLALSGCGSSGSGSSGSAAGGESTARTQEEAREEEKAENQNSAQTSGTDADGGGAAREISGSGAEAGGEAQAGSAEEVYAGNDGWSVVYDPSVIEAAQTGDHSSQFVYIGESAGTNMVTISFVSGKQPEEALYELTSQWGDDENTDRSEGILPGTSDKWGYWRVLDGTGEGSGLSQTAIAGEYNGGVLIFECIEHRGREDEADMMVSDTLAGIINSITYENFEPQVEYSYVPGKYIRSGEENHSIVLNEDHTGVISLQDDIDVLWGSYELMRTDGTESFEYTIEGDLLYLDYYKDGSGWTEFKKDSISSPDSASERKLPEYEYSGEDRKIDAVCRYIVDEYASDYERADVSIPCPVIVDIDEGDPDDIRVYGDFWIFNYDLKGTTLMMKSGGSYPGVMHLEPADYDEFKVTKVETVEDGEGWNASARKIFGDRYDAFMKLEDTAGVDEREKVRAEIIADYVRDNNLSITRYKDYGWDAVKLEL